MLWTLEPGKQVSVRGQRLRQRVLTLSRFFSQGSVENSMAITRAPKEAAKQKNVIMR